MNRKFRLWNDCCGVLLFLVLVLAMVGRVGADSKIYIDRAFHTRTNEYLVSLLCLGPADHANEEEREKAKKALGFPPEIDSNASWFAATLTDGKELWTVFAFTLVEVKDFSLEKYDTPLFRLKLFQNEFIRNGFPEGQIKLIKRNSRLYLLPPQFPDDFNWSELESIWSYLEFRTVLGVYFGPCDRELYPTLPPKTENEGAYLQLLRKNRKNKTINRGKWEDDIVSEVYGLQWDHETQMWRIFFESNAKEGSSLAKRYAQWNQSQSPFRVGGFYNSSDLSFFTCGFRFEPDLGEGVDHYITMGIYLIPLEERENNSVYYIRLGGGFVSERTNEVSKRTNEDDQVLCFDLGSLKLYAPKQPDNLPEEEGVLSAEKLSL